MTSPTESITFSQGDALWHDMRRRATESIPGKYSSLYYLNAKILQREAVVPMTYRAHWGMCLFAEGMTGIPEIDSARVRMVLVPRGTGKTTLISNGLATQKLLKFDDYSLGIANEGQRMADRILSGIKMEFERNELLQALWPERLPRDDATWRQDQITIGRTTNRVDPSVIAAGVGANITGVHLDMWILDDLLSREAAEAARKGNFSRIEDTNFWVTTLEPLLTFPKRSPVVVCATYWWDGDTYCWMEGDEEERGFWGHGEPIRTYSWNLRLPDGTRQTLELRRRGEVAMFVRPIYDERGNSWFPERLSNDELELMREQDPAFFASQYLLKPTAAGATLFDDKWLRTYSLEGSSVRFRNNEGRLEYVPLRDMTFLVSVDPAFADKNSSARTAIPVVGVAGERIFLFEDFAERGMGVHDIAAKVLEFVERYNPRKLFVETIVAQIAVSDVIKRELKRAGKRITVEEISSHGQSRKEMRIYALEPYFRGGNFYIRPDHTNFRHEYLGFPRMSLRDLLDAVSFQKEEWERLLSFGTGTSFGGASQADRKALLSDLDRIRRAFRRDAPQKEESKWL